MSTNISNIYDAIQTRLASLYPTGSRLLNPYQVNDNPDLLLQFGYGCSIQNASSNRRLLSNQLSLTRQFKIVNTRKFFALQTDPASKGVTEKQLMEDQMLVIKDFEKETTINGTAIMTNYVSDSGVRPVSGQTDKFLCVETFFAIDYFENY